MSVTASIFENALTVEPITGDRRRLRKCRCGCERKATHAVVANGLHMAESCELSAWRFKRKAERAVRFASAS